MSEYSTNSTRARRVVITGVGSVSALGRSVPSLWKACLSGCSGVTHITGFDTTGYTTRIAAEIKEWSAEPYMDKKEARRMDKFIQYAVASATMAVQDSGLDIDDGSR